MVRRDVWSAGDLYEPYVGRWSRLVAKEFVAWLGVPVQSSWVDVGCGTGALTETVLQQAQPRTVTGVDPSNAFLEHARIRVTDARVFFQVAHAQQLPMSSGEHDAAVAGLVLNFVPDPSAAVTEMARVVRSGGTVGAYVWDYAGKMELMRCFWDAAAAHDPDATDLDEGRRFPICASAPLTDLFAQAGLQNVEVRSIDVPTRFRDFDDYWTPFLGGQGPAPGYAMSLNEDRRARLRERIRSDLPVRDDGSIHLVARAWALRGRVC